MTTVRIGNAARSVAFQTSSRKHASMPPGKRSPRQVGGCRRPRASSLLYGRGKRSRRTACGKPLAVTAAVVRPRQRDERQVVPNTTDLGQGLSARREPDQNRFGRVHTAFVLRLRRWPRGVSRPLVWRDIMPAKSRAQQKAAGAALAAKRGKQKVSALKGASRKHVRLNERKRAR